MDTRKLRQHLREQRASLSPGLQDQCAHAAANILSRHRLFRKARHVGCYIAADGELDTDPIIQQAFRSKKHIYLPQIVNARERQMRFLDCHPAAPLLRNRWGLLEPIPSIASTCFVNQLDLIITPLVGYTEAGDRLGMGGGFYDRLLAEKNRHRYLPPTLVGYAYECQQCDHIERREWDVPMDYIVTQHRLIHCRR